MKKVILCILLTGLLLASATIAGCAGTGGNDRGPVETGSAQAENETPDAQESSAAIEITDMVGRTVKMDAPATGVVAITAADVETLFAVGAGNLLVGRGEYCNYPEEALEVQSVQSGYETNIEQIIALEPQLLIMATMDQNEDQVRQCEDAGITVFVTDAHNIAGAYTAIDSIGILVGKENEARAIIVGMKDTFTDLSAKAAAYDGEQKTIYYEVSPLEFGLWTAGSGTFMNEVAEMLGTKNIFDDVTGWAEISEEQVLERNPDYIMTVGMYFGEGLPPVESILARPGWGNITAIKNKAILNLTDDELSRPGPRLALGAQMLYDFMFEGA